MLFGGQKSPKTTAGRFGLYRQYPAGIIARPSPGPTKLSALATGVKAQFPGRFTRLIAFEERPMPAKKPAPKAAKGKKAASRPPVKKAVMARKLPAERTKAAAA